MGNPLPHHESPEEGGPGGSGRRGARGRPGGRVWGFRDCLDPEV